MSRCRAGGEQQLPRPSPPELLATRAGHSRSALVIMGSRRLGWVGASGPQHYH